MAKPQSSSLKKDLRVFGDPGFLVTLLIIGILCAVGTWVLLYATDRYGISVREYWR
jgi:hypothetical protein